MKAETVVAPAAIALGGSLAAGTVLGVPILALVAGFAGGVIVLTKGRELKLWQAAGTLAASTLMSGFGGQLAAAIGAALLKRALPEIVVPPDAALSAASLLVGIGVQVSWHAAIRAVNRRIDRYGG